MIKLFSSIDVFISHHLTLEATTLIKQVTIFAREQNSYPLKICSTSPPTKLTVSFFFAMLLSGPYLFLLFSDSPKLFLNSF